MLLAKRNILIDPCEIVSNLKEIRELFYNVIVERKEKEVTACCTHLCSVEQYLKRTRAKLILNFLKNLVKSKLDNIVMCISHVLQTLRSSIAQYHLRRFRCAILSLTWPWMRT